MMVEDIYIDRKMKNFGGKNFARQLPINSPKFCLNTNPQFYLDSFCINTLTTNAICESFLLPKFFSTVATVNIISYIATS